MQYGSLQTLWQQQKVPATSTFPQRNKWIKMIPLLLIVKNRNLAMCPSNHKENHRSQIEGKEEDIIYYPPISHS